MHAEPPSDRRHPIPILSNATGLGLYFLTLALELMLGGASRCLLVYLGAAITATVLPLWPGPETLAYLAALAPIGWSLLGLVLPGRGRVWGRRLGARRPSGEEAATIDDAMVQLHSSHPGQPGPAACQLLDDPLPAAAVRGHTLILSRGLVESESLTAVLAHEMGHLDSLDGRLTEALQRLVLWGDPLGPARTESGEEPRLQPDPDPRGGLLWSTLRWGLRLAGGSIVQGLLSPLWAAHWRAREYAADARAASLGQAEDLARHLADFEQPFDPPQRRGPFNRSEYPPVAHRLERLRALAAQRGSK